MKILHLHDNPTFQGGIERILYDMASSLSAYGNQGLLFTKGGSDSQFFAPFQWHGMSLREAVNNFKPDIAIVHKVRDSRLIELACNKIPTLVFVHDHDMTCPRRHKYLPGSDKPCTRAVGPGCFKNLCFVEKAPTTNIVPVQLFQGIQRQRNLYKSCAKSRRLIVASMSMFKELLINGIDPRRISIIPPTPIGLDKVNPMPLSDQPNLLYIGQVIRGKGVDLLLKAMKQIKVPCTATIVGSGNHLAECQRLAENLGLTPRVNFAGWVNYSSLDPYYRASQVAIVPSRWPEPFGMVGIEAMARARPVVAFDSGGISDWLLDGVTGLTAKPGDTLDLADKIQSLLLNKKLREFMAQRAFHSVRLSFRHEKFIEQLINVAKEIKRENDNFCLRS